MIHVIRAIVVTTLAVTLGACAQSQTIPSQSNQAAVYQAVVAADHELASHAGAQILRQGGNAVDAAVATSLALSVVRPYSCGLGGGGFMIIAFNNDPVHGDLKIALDYRETAPSAVGEDYFVQTGRSSQRGGAAVAVPGTVAGLLHAHERFGVLSRETVCMPAIKLAESGFKADAHYVAAAQGLAARFDEHPDWIERFPMVWESFLLKGTVQVGDRIHVPEQAAALRLIVEKGRDGFYTGEVARRIIHAARKSGGDLSLEDLRRYRPVEREPVSIVIDGYTFIGMPPPSSGGVTMFEAFKIMASAGYDFSAPADDALSVHLLAESFKHAFADRAEWFGDPGFKDVPVDQLLSQAYTEGLAFKIDRQQTQPPAAYGSHAQLPDDSGTSHFSIVDASGNAVACTETINLEFGSLVGVDGFGFLLNDEMDDFLTQPGVPNAFGLMQSERNLPAPGKRPLSSMSPTMVFDENGLLVTAGASGGPRIITGTAQAILRVLAHQSAAQAVSHPRIHHQWLPNRLDLEPGALTPDIRAALEARGHVLGDRSEIGNVQLIRRVSGGWEAASDPRKGGKPVGY